MNRSDVLFYTGMGLVTGGAVIASPLDELAVTAGTGGLGAVIAPIQGVVTAGAGILGIIGGFGLIYLSTVVDGSNSE